MRSPVKKKPKPANFYLSEEARDKLVWLADFWGLSRSDTVERLIKAYHSVASAQASMDAPVPAPMLSLAMPASQLAGVIAHLLHGV